MLIQLVTVHIARRLWFLCSSQVIILPFNTVI
jgi:hypothetical protein